jgi:hypothetical protein
VFVSEMRGEWEGFAWKGEVCTQYRRRFLFLNPLFLFVREGKI